MTQFYAYKDAFGASGTFEVALDYPIRLGELDGLSEMAEHLAAGSCTLTFDDPDADLGNAGDAILGLQRIKVTETAMASGNQRLYTGIIGTRTYSRGEHGITGASREIGVELHDLNALMSLRVIPNSDQDAKRPRETVTARMAWIMSTNYMNGVVDNGFVESNATMMTKNDYRGQRPANVVNDCEMSAGFGWNAFVYWDEAAAEPALWFDNANTSTTFTSLLRISNVLGDLDTATAATFLTGTTFAPSEDATLSRDPSDLGSGVYLPFKNGAVYRTRSDTITAYGRKDIIAPNSNVSSRDRAEEQADDFAYQHSTEEDRITVTVELPPNKVNLIRAGHRIQVKFQHLPGYESFTWMRVVERAPGQQKPTDDRYWMRLVLSPQEAPCADSVLPTEVQYAHYQGVTHHTPNYTYTISLSAPSTIGNLLVLSVMSQRNFGTNATIAATPTGWTAAVFEELTDPLPSLGGSYCSVFYKTSEGEQSVDILFNGLDGNWFTIAEYAGLSNPVPFTAAEVFQQGPDGWAEVPATSYPAGPTAVLFWCFMEDGPLGADDLTAEGSGMVITYPVTGVTHSNIVIGMAQMLRDSTAGATITYPTAGYWRFLYTGSGNTVTVGLAFEGSDCGEITTPDPVPEGGGGGGGDGVPPPTGPAVYIAPDGDDTTGDGSLTNPWQTIGKFLAMPPVPGDRLYCRGGTYPTVAGNYNHYVTGVAGTSTDRIMIAAYPGETPVFDGGCDTSLTDRHFICLRGGSDYWIIDGLTIVNYLQALFGIVNIGHTAVTTPTEHTILRNLYIEMAESPLAGNGDHAIYIQNYVDDTIIQDCELVGPVDATGTTGAGVHVFHSPDATNTVLRRVFSRKWEQGFEMDGASANGTIEWSTFKDNTAADMHFYDHAAWLIRNNVSDGSASVFYDEDGSGPETSTNNYPTETLNADGTLQVGSSAIGGATDGSDAGAFQS